MKDSNTENMNESVYWRSFRELNKDPEFFEAKAHEFMKGVTDDFDLSKVSGISRRRFLALMSASAAFAAAGCGDYHDKGEVIPYNKKPQEVLPGQANYYASTCNGCKQACGILVKTREGRPIKIDGNPDHPINQGKICSIGQASIINLYDPVRLKSPLKKSGNTKVDISWSKADDEIISELSKAASAGKEIAIISHTILSPTGKKVSDDFIAKYPTTKIYTYELVNEDSRNSAWQSNGTSVPPSIKWDAAKIILALESDFLGGEGNTIENIRLFSRNRDVMQSKDFNRLYSAEGAVTLTGLNADYRLRIRPDAQYEFVLALSNEIGKRLGGSNGSPSPSLKDFASKHKLKSEVLNHLVEDLVSNRGASIVYAGSSLPVEVHSAVNGLNNLLGNTAVYNTERMPVQYYSASKKEDWENLISKMKSGNAIVIHYDTNPVYHFSPEYGYKEALKNVPVSISLSEAANETSAFCKYTLPLHHYLESWGDYNTRDGIYSLQQPVISPILNTRQKESVLLTWINGNGSHTEDMYHKYLMNNWEQQIHPSLNSPIEFKSFWFSSLEVGAIVGQPSGSSYSSIQTNITSEHNTKSTGDGYLLYIKPNYYLGDGRYANNGWLQELPHPVTKVVWDNYASISPSTAKELNVEENDLIEVEVNGRKKSLPVYVQAGMADKLIVTELGYGRTNAGEVGNEVGVNINELFGKSGGISPWLYNAKVRKTGDTYKLVSTQEHHSLDDTFVKDFQFKRDLIREYNLDEYKKNPAINPKDEHKPLSVTKGVEYKGVKWAMSIDLNKCLGCNQCVVACNIENNIPVVGKEQVEKGREMHWLRIDRYYTGTPDEPKANMQPMLCQHCDNAPCENPCPVAATTHSPDGLNQMAYNRCVGTRYCSNNCPYKVRRFNFYNFRDHFADGYYEQENFSLVQNPEVTVRSRGVMEKCTFCIQRIMEARENATEQGRQIKGSDVQTACQQACPSNAIVFGDMHDPESEVSKYREHELGFYVLNEINTRPNVTYISKLRNTHTEDI